ncbi:hypothetical protein [Sphingobium sp. B2]|uniref:hypothetical protein n=1 Tax=Sphingobium sp. B2 TaxID=2583228 RepID=UPI0011A1DA63|nr:hypothetical protein [Sphingobium sp. B2]
MTTLFIEADEPLLVFASIEMAEQHLEPLDVESGVYTRAFGPTGELFSIETDGESVTIRNSKQPADPDSLCALLRRSLQQIGELVPMDADLPTLVAFTEDVWTRRQRDVTTKFKSGGMLVLVILGGLAALYLGLR